MEKKHRERERRMGWVMRDRKRLHNQAIEREREGARGEMREP